MSIEEAERRLGIRVLGWYWLSKRSGYIQYVLRGGSKTKQERFMESFDLIYLEIQRVSNREALKKITLVALVLDAIGPITCGLWMKDV